MCDEPNHNYCIPGSKHIDTIDGRTSCLSKRALQSIVKVWNRHNQKDRINLLYSKKDLWKQLDKRLSTKECNEEWCWLDTTYFKQISEKQIKTEIINSYKPLESKDWEKDNDWLSTTDILNAMKQYEKKYTNFSFLGAVPIDFDYKIEGQYCIDYAVCTLNVKQSLKKGKKYIGIVFNLDPHDKPGTHWICMFIDIPNLEINYFDSYGLLPPKQVDILIKRIQTQIKGDWNVKINRTRHQYSYSECGTYCIYFILERLKGTTYNNVVKQRIEDKTVIDKRKCWFTPRKT